MSVFCLCCQTVERATCSRCGGSACGRCDRCFGCDRIVCAGCDSQPTPVFANAGDAQSHPHNRAGGLPSKVALS